MTYAGRVGFVMAGLVPVIHVLRMSAKQLQAAPKHRDIPKATNPRAGGLDRFQRGR